MKKQRVKKKTSNIINQVAQSWFEYAKQRKLKNNVFKKAAIKVAKETDEHFKKDGWDLDYGNLVSEVFCQATGEQLEWYLLQALKGKYTLKLKDGDFVLSKGKNGKSIKK